MAAEIILEVLQPGRRAAELLDCFSAATGIELKTGSRDPIYLNRVDLTAVEGVESVREQLARCGDDWAEHVSVYVGKDQGERA